MTLIRATLPLALTLVAGAAPLRGQEGKLAVNLRVNGAAQIGVTWHASKSVAVRPGLRANWIRVSDPFGGEAETTQLGLDVDVLIRAGASGRVTAYYGLGASVLHVNSDGPDVTLRYYRGLFGARVSVLERVALFGEIGLEYQDRDEPDVQGLTLATFPLGVAVYLK